MHDVFHQHGIWVAVTWLHLREKLDLFFVSTIFHPWTEVHMYKITSSSNASCRCGKPHADAAGVGSCTPRSFHLAAPFGKRRWTSILPSREPQLVRVKGMDHKIKVIYVVLFVYTVYHMIIINLNVYIYIHQYTIYTRQLYQCLYIYIYIFLKGKPPRGQHFPNLFLCNEKVSAPAYYALATSHVG